MKHLLLIGMTAMLAVQSSFGQAPKYSNEFLNIGVGARGLAMSGAQITSVQDVSAAYWNPAGLSGLNHDLQAMYQHAEYFAGIAKYDYAGVATRIDSNSVIGLNFVRFGVDDIPNTTELIDQNGQVNYDRITSFSAADYAMMASYARKLGVPGLTVGGNAKVVYRQIGDMARAWGFGLDAGVQYTYKKWRFGAVGRDITSTFNAWSFSLDSTTVAVFESTNNEIPQNGLEVTLPKLVLGASRSFTIKENFGVLAEVNLDFTTDGRRNVLIPGDPISIDPKVGFEFDYKRIVFLRAGFGNFQRIKATIGNYYEYSFQPNIGIGINIKDRFSLNYALTDIGDNSVALYSNIFSLRVGINKKSG